MVQAALQGACSSPKKSGITYMVDELNLQAPAARRLHFEEQLRSQPAAEAAPPPAGAPAWGSAPAPPADGPTAVPAWQPQPAPSPVPAAAPSQLGSAAEPPAASLQHAALGAAQSPRLSPHSAQADPARSPPCAAASQLAAARPSADAGRAAPFAFLLGDKQLQPRAAAAGLAAGPASSATPTHAALRPPPSSPQQAQQAQPSPSGPGASPASGKNVHRWVEQYRQRAAVAAAARSPAGAAATPGAGAGACSPPRPAARGQAARLPTADALAAAEAATLYPSPHVFWHSQPRQLLTHLAPLLAAETVPLRAIMACSSMAGGVERVGWFILFEAAGVLGTLFLSMHECMQLHLRSLDSKTAKGEGSRSCRGLALLFGFSGSTYVGTPCCAYRETRLHLLPSPLQPPSPAHPSTMQPSACITWALPCST